MSTIDNLGNVAGALAAVGAIALVALTLGCATTQAPAPKASAAQSALGTVAAAGERVVALASELPATTPQRAPLATAGATVVTGTATARADVDALARDLAAARAEIASLRERSTTTIVWVLRGAAVLLLLLTALRLYLAFSAGDYVTGLRAAAPLAGGALVLWGVATIVGADWFATAAVVAAVVAAIALLAAVAYDAYARHRAAAGEHESDTLLAKVAGVVAPVIAGAATGDTASALSSLVGTLTADEKAGLAELAATGKWRE